MRAPLESHPRIVWRAADLPRRPFRRIVSLVPSLSEALVALGLGDRLVGVTAYCVEPPGAFDGLPKVGGTKDADVAAIAALRPELVIANQEENTARVVRGLAEAGIDVWVTYPRTVRAGAELLRDLAGLGAPLERVAAVVDPVFAALEAAESRRARGPATRPVRVFCAIWRDPWMTIGRDTYIHDLIELCGGANVFAEPMGASIGASTGASMDASMEEPVAGAEAGPAKGASADSVAAASAASAAAAVPAAPASPSASAAGASSAERRYPIVDRAAIVAAQPEVILLPSEPYAFGERDREELLGLACPAAASRRVHCIDGSLVSWYGPRIAEAIRVLGPLLANA